MDIDSAAESFSAMGSESRLRVVKTLVRAGDEGLTVGQIQDRTGIAPSTLAHHLKFLAAGNVLTQEKQGRSVVNRANLNHLEDLAHFILCECCADMNKKAANDG